MQPGSGGGGGADLAGIDCLVAFLVLKLLLNIRRQRHLADLVKNSVEIPLIREFDQTVSILYDFQYFGSHESVAKGKAISGLGTFAGAGQYLPNVVPFRGKKQKFHPCPRSLFDAVYSGGKNAGIVQNQTVVWVQIIDDVIKMPVLNLTAFLVQN